jgi:hypothetical protein
MVLEPLADREMEDVLARARGRVDELGEVVVGRDRRRRRMILRGAASERRDDEQSEDHALHGKGPPRLERKVADAEM